MEVLLLNVDDRSVVTRSVTKSKDWYSYELDENLIDHYGQWKGQLQLKKGTETYVSSPFSFRIENDLQNDRPPQLTEVNNWKNLRAIANGLIADIRSELDLVAAKVSEIDGAETTRQQAESQRQSTFKTNETERQNTFETAEQERQSAELTRVENENQRKTDHANRSAELNGKADKKQEDWITPTLLNGWTNFGGVYESVGYMKDEFGFVHLKGMVKGGSVGQNIFFLPEGYQPLKSQYHACVSADIVRTLNIQANGGAFISTVASSNWVTLNGISFKAGA
ncbi:hypothetical protein AAF695_02760 [Aerococcus viridans]